MLTACPKCLRRLKVAPGRPDRVLTCPACRTKFQLHLSECVLPLVPVDPVAASLSQPIPYHSEALPPSSQACVMPGLPSVFAAAPPYQPVTMTALVPPPSTSPEPAQLTKSEAEVILSSNLVEHARLKFRVLVEPGTTKETVQHHLLEIYRALNDYLVERFGTYLPANDFRRLVADEALRSAKA